jgi:hypothetical protein
VALVLVLVLVCVLVLMLVCVPTPVNFLISDTPGIRSVKVFTLGKGGVWPVPSRWLILVFCFELPKSPSAKATISSMYCLYASARLALAAAVRGLTCLEAILPSETFPTGRPGPRPTGFVVVAVLDTRGEVLVSGPDGVGKGLFSKSTRFPGESDLLFLLRRLLLGDVMAVGNSTSVVLIMPEFRAPLIPSPRVVLIGPGAALRRPLLRLFAAIVSLCHCQSRSETHCVLWGG